MVNSEGSVFIATANDNAVGMYTCTAYNSYGTMGQSEPTQVILQVLLLTPPLVTEKTFFFECVQLYMGRCDKDFLPLPGPPIFQSVSPA